ncbi:MAG: hypothetical protein QW117_02420 [Candidatus Pacearchaeota archaeon]
MEEKNLKKKLAKGISEYKKLIREKEATEKKIAKHLEKETAFIEENLPEIIDIAKEDYEKWREKEGYKLKREIQEALKTNDFDRIKEIIEYAKLKDIEIPIKKRVKELFSPSEREELLEYAKKAAEKEWYSDAGMIAAKVGAKKEALEYAKKAAEEGKYYYAGMIAAKVGAKKEALEYAKKVAEKEWYYDAGKIAAKVGAKKEALEYAKKAADEKEWYYAAGEIAAEVGAKKEALEYAKIAAEKEWYSDAGMIAAKVGAKKEALEYAKKAADEKEWYYAAGKIANEILNYYL